MGKGQVCQNMRCGSFGRTEGTVDEYDYLHDALLSSLEQLHGLRTSDGWALVLCAWVQVVHGGKLRDKIILVGQ